MKDTTTGDMYPSKFGAGKVVAAEYGLDTDDNFVRYQIVPRAPERFVDADEQTRAVV